MPSLPLSALSRGSAMTRWALGGILALLAGWVGMTGCARVAPPSGGLKDTLAPRLMFTVPRSGTTHFRGQRLVFEFSEQVTLEQATRQIIISPPLEPTNTVTPRVRGRRVDLTFSEPLPQGRTYNVNLRRAVVDITEANPAEGVRLVFSTGATLDTMSIRGVVRRLQTGAAAADVSVALWPDSDTLDITRQRALYVTRTDAEGAFELENLPDSVFFVAALVDGNNNLRWDGRREPLAFLSRRVRPSALAGVGVELALSLIDDAPPRLTRARLRPDTTLELTFSEGLTLAEVRVPRAFRARPTDSLVPLTGGTETADVLAHLLDKPAGGLIARPLPVAGGGDTIALRVLAHDSAFLLADTLIRLSLSRPGGGAGDRTERRSRQTDEPAAAPAPARTVAWQLEGAGAGPLPLPGRLSLVLPEPPSRWATYMPVLRVRRDTNATPRPVPPGALRRQPTGFAGQYYWELRPIPEAGLVAGGRVEVLLPSGGMTHAGAVIRGDTVVLRFLGEEQTGLIRGRVKPGVAVGTAPAYTGPFVVMLYDNRGRLLDERGIATAGPFEFAGLPAGAYQIQILEDANGNARFDPGSYRANRQPERLRPPVAVQLKANWEVELE